MTIWGTLGQPTSTASARINLQTRVGSISLRHATYDAGAQVSLHRHECASIVYGAGGPCIELSASGERVSRRRLTFLPAGHEHALHYLGPTQVLVTEVHPIVAESLGINEARGSLALPASFYDRMWDILGLLAKGDQAGLSRALESFWSASAVYLAAKLPSWLPELIDRLHEDWETQPSATNLARELGFSPQYLCRAFKRTIGLTLKQYNQSVRLDYARALLWGSGRSISEIATITGFADQSHLTRVLRQRSGQTPVKLRSTGLLNRKGFGDKGARIAARRARERGADRDPVDPAQPLQGDQRPLRL